MNFNDDTFRKHDHSSTFSLNNFIQFCRLSFDFLTCNFNNFFAYYFRSRRRDWRRKDWRWSFFDACMIFFWLLWFFHSLNSLLERREFFFESDIAVVDLFNEFFESFTRFSDRDWFDRLFNRSVINIVIFCFIVFPNCWKFSDIVSLYDVVVVFNFLIRSMNANSKLFFVWIWSIAIDTLSVKSRFTFARSIWLIRFCIVTCSIFAIFRSSNKIFCAFFNVSFIDSTSVRILIESNFFFNAIWRSSFVFLFGLNNASSFRLDVDRSIVFVSFKRALLTEVSMMLCSICWSNWLWF